VSDLLLVDVSHASKWRTFHGDAAPGTSSGSGDRLTWSVSPGEWTALGEKPEGDVVDLTHVRAMFRLTGEAAAALINRVCGLDLSDGMFPSGAAARTLFAGVATEIVRDDEEGTPSYLVVPSSSFKRYIRDVIEDAGTDLGLTPG